MKAEELYVKCNICKWNGAVFLPCRGRNNARCPKCLSLERHRFHNWLVQKTKLGDEIANSHVLLIGPRFYDFTILKSAKQITTIDIVREKAEICGIVESLPFKSQTFNVVWASHVLEHIPKLSKALNEIFRVLTVGGIAVLDVPIYGEETYHLREPDHIGHCWAPGYDWFKHYNLAGFSVKQHKPLGLPKEYGFDPQNIVAQCRKTNRNK